MKKRPSKGKASPSPMTQPAHMTSAPETQCRVPGPSNSTRQARVRSAVDAQAAAPASPQALPWGGSGWDFLPKDQAGVPGFEPVPGQDTGHIPGFEERGPSRGPAGRAGEPGRTRARAAGRAPQAGGRRGPRTVGPAAGAPTPTPAPSGLKAMKPLPGPLPEREPAYDRDAIKGMMNPSSQLSDGLALWESTFAQENAAQAARAAAAAKAKAPPQAPQGSTGRAKKPLSVRDLGVPVDIRKQDRVDLCSIPAYYHDPALARQAGLDCRSGGGPKATVLNDEKTATGRRRSLMQIADGDSVTQLGYINESSSSTIMRHSDTKDIHQESVSGESAPFENKTATRGRGTSQQDKFTWFDKRESKAMGLLKTESTSLLPAEIESLTGVETEGDVTIAEVSGDAGLTLDSKGVAASAGATATIAQARAAAKVKQEHLGEHKVQAKVGMGFGAKASGRAGCSYDEDAGKQVCKVGFSAEGGFGPYGGLKYDATLPEWASKPMAKVRDWVTPDVALDLSHLTNPKRPVSPEQ